MRDLHTVKGQLTRTGRCSVRIGRCPRPCAAMSGRRRPRVDDARIWGRCDTLVSSDQRNSGRFWEASRGAVARSTLLVAAALPGTGGVGPLRPTAEAPLHSLPRAAGASHDLGVTVDVRSRVHGRPHCSALTRPNHC